MESGRSPLVSTTLRAGIFKDQGQGATRKHFLAWKTRPENRNSIRSHFTDGVQPIFSRHHGCAGAEDTDSNSTSVRSTAQRIQSSTQHRASEWRVQVEDRATSKIRC